MDFFFDHVQGKAFARDLLGQEPPPGFDRYHVDYDVENDEATAEHLLAIDQFRSDPDWLRKQLPPQKIASAA